MSDLVAINGLGGLAYFWDGVLDALPQFDVRVLDLPGHGDLPPAHDYHYSALVEDALVRTANLAPFHLAGWSVGGAVAWLLAARHPERVRSLVLIEPAAPHQNPFRHGLPPDPVHAYTYSSISKLVAAFGTIDPTFNDEDAKRAYRLNAAGRWEPSYDPAILPALVEDARDSGEELYFELERIVIPSLIVRGERSFIRESQIEEIAAALPDVRVRTIAGGGHFVVKERPREVAAVLAEFLSAVEAGQAAGQDSQPR